MLFFLFSSFSPLSEGECARIVTQSRRFSRSGRLKIAGFMVISPQVVLFCRGPASRLGGQPGEGPANLLVLNLESAKGRKKGTRVAILFGREQGFLLMRRHFPPIAAPHGYRDDPAQPWVPIVQPPSEKRPEPRRLCLGLEARGPRPDMRHLR